MSVTFEHLREALGVGTARPRLSWPLPAGVPDGHQHAYQLELLDDAGARVLLETVESPERVLVPWPGPPLRSRERREVRVRMRMHGADWSPWSTPAVVEAGLLERSDWVARPVGPPAGADHEAQPVLRRRFRLRGPVASARLYATALGLYEVTINGRAVSDDVLAPGWQSYDRLLRYRTLDVAEALIEGENEIAVALGDGWYRGRLGFLGERAVYGDRLAFLGQLELVHADGRREVIATDDDWEWRPGPTLSSDLYDGEHHDARDPFAGRAWVAVDVHPFPTAELIAPVAPPVRRVQTLPVAAVSRSPSGRVLVDFGQNLVGRVRLRVRGPRGSTVTLRHAEVLEHGELGTRPLRSARATDRYVLSGDGEEIWEPRFTYHGFRFVEVDGWPTPDGELETGDLEAVVVHDDMRRTGWFASSDPLLDRLHENVVWGMRGNFVDIPTDCPQRDERLGWTGDIGVFVPTAAYLYDCAGMLSAWLRNLAVDQGADGMVPFFVPKLEFPPEVADVPGLVHSHAAAWGDAAVIVPFSLHQAFGDEEVLRRQFGSMRAWVDGVERLAGPTRVWSSGFQFGDWLDPTAPPESPGDGATDKTLVATAYFARSARLLARTAEILHEADAAAHYGRLADEVTSAFRRAFVHPDGRLTSDTQTAYSLALCFDLYADDDERMRGGERLKELVRASGHVIATGFVGTPLILDALTLADGLDDAYRLLLQTELPSWLYTVQMGGTTIWERWDSMLPDGSINPGEMTSFNHYALGAVADWMHRTVGGLAPLEPGYRRQLFAPRPRGGLTHAETAHLTPYGRAAIAWQLVAGEDGTETLEVEVQVPPGTSAVVDLEGQSPVDVPPGRHRFAVPHTVSGALLGMEKP